AIEQALRRADVLVIGFSLFPQRLLVDLRAHDDTGPMVAVVDPVGGIRERYLWLGRHRGMFGAPEAFSFLPWPHSIRGLRELDVLGTLRTRLAEISNDGPHLLDRAIDRLAELESEAIRDAVRGEGPWKTV